MSKYEIYFEAWTTVEAESDEEAYSTGQTIVNELEQLVSNAMALSEPLEIVVSDRQDWGG